MEPQTIIGQVAQTMNGNQPALNQVSQGAPIAQPGLQPPPTQPMPEKSPASEIHATALHRAFARRNLPMPSQLQPPPIENTMNQNGSINVAPAQEAPPVSEAELILKAMSKHLDRKGKAEEKVLDALLSSMHPAENQQTESGVAIPPTQTLPH